MTVREDTTKELTAAKITKWVELSTQESVKTMRKDLEKRAAAIKTRYDAFLEGMRYEYSAATMLPGEYIYRVTGLDAAWTFIVPDLPETYNPSIISQNAVTIAKMEAAWDTRQEEHEVYLGVEDVTKQLIINAYYSCFLE